MQAFNRTLEVPPITLAEHDEQQAKLAEQRSADPVTVEVDCTITVTVPEHYEGKLPEGYADVIPTVLDLILQHAAAVHVAKNPGDTRRIEAISLDVRGVTSPAPQS